MNKVLFVATVDSHIKQFHMPYLKWFKDDGYEVHVATNSDKPIEFCDKKHCISMGRNPLKISNIKAIKQLKTIIEQEKIQIIHCHTPVGAVVTRIAAKKARKHIGTKVIYTAHGFHFYKGAPIINWLIFYPIEKILARLTDCIITINQEDYEIAKNKFHAKRIEYVNGVGVITDRLEVNFSKEQIKNRKQELNIPEENIVLTYVAELNENKNQQFLIEIMQELIKEKSDITLLLVGDGDKREDYQKMIQEKKLDTHIKLLGYRKDIGEILAITDICTASSLREGLPINIIECMYMGIPIVATNNRGHRELVKSGENGYIIEIGDKKRYIEKIKELIEKPSLRKAMGEKSQEMAKPYTIEKVMKEMEKIYKEIINK